MEKRDILKCFEGVLMKKIYYLVIVNLVIQKIPMSQMLKNSELKTSLLTVIMISTLYLIIQQTMIKIINLFGQQMIHNSMLKN